MVSERYREREREREREERTICFALEFECIDERERGRDSVGRSVGPSVGLYVHLS